MAREVVRDGRSGDSISARYLGSALVRGASRTGLNRLSVGVLDSRHHGIGVGHPALVGVIGVDGRLP